MELLYYLLRNFINEEIVNIIILIAISLGLTLLQTNGISYTTARIIESVHNKNMAGIFTNFKYYVGVTLGFIALMFIYKVFQAKILNKLGQWTRNEMLKLILKVNNENMSSVNFTDFYALIARTAVQLYNLFSNLVSMFIPTVALLLLVLLYFMYNNPTLGIAFLVGNLCIVGYIAYFWNEMTESKENHEGILSKNDKFLTEILKNIDKVIYRGQVNTEVDNYTNINDFCLKSSVEYMKYMITHTSILITMVNITVFVCSWLLITLQTSKSIDVTTFITFFTILLLYRERVTSAVSELHEYVDFSGRLKHTSKKFREMTGDFNKMTEMVEKTYPTIETAFDTIVFDKVSFKYNKTNRWIFENLNLNLNLNNNIIGVVGKSGKGKSSFVKLLLRLYDCTEGTIYLDGRDITQIDPDYIRSNITYVNQTGKLFDKNVVENMLYGCNNLDKCNSALHEVFQYDKIRALFQNIDLTSTSAGSLGENLSGGQRQIVNIISGLIHPSKILILDEPTNALDPEIKKQLLAILAKFKEYKKSIIIITHDKDVYSLFDQTLKL